MESKHIKAVKEPWNCLNCFEALGWMLMMNKHLDKLSAFHIHYTHGGWLSNSLISVSVVLTWMDREDKEGAVDGECSMYVVQLTQHHGRLCICCYTNATDYHCSYFLPSAEDSHARCQPITIHSSISLQPDGPQCSNHQRPSQHLHVSCV
ncbi:hypothetical protein ID866_8381 [Astraeus odoratus]|nr:hypothetical protein ID866_8381 [Astraeus odoratus]